ncbi:MAG: TonB-dependent receptor [Bacteroidia bacterium]|nr:TonB-dependent receptor [Bacteroidia bacterium]
MKKAILFILILGNISLFAQKTISLKVLSELDSSAIPNAIVEIKYLFPKNEQHKKISDKNGLAEFVLYQSGKFNLFISKDGFKTYYSAVNPDELFIKVYLKPLAYDIEEITVAATRSGGLNIATNTVLTKKEIENRDFAQGVPTLLQFLPSVVNTSDAGTGIGYSGISIRGTDATRINVTINGVPLNDAESQTVYWVDLPDFAGNTENIQVQRGVGTSTNGAAAFGASINLKTDKFSEIPYSKISFSVGSFNTKKQTVKIATGKMKNNWYAESRLSSVTSDGFIDRAFSDLKSFYFTTGHKTEKRLFQILLFSGKEKTYQAWNGVPLVKFNNNINETDSLINFLGYDSLHASQLQISNPKRYNYYNYKNETDNYIQSHLQIIYNIKLNKNSFLNFALHGTAGKGYYENYEYKTDLVNYIDTPAVWNGIKYYNSDLIRQRWLDNKFIGLVFSYNSSKAKTENIIGGGFNFYYGKHFGDIVWYELMNKKEGNIRYYSNNSYKTDANIYWKMQYKLRKDLFIFTDIQLRHIYYEWYGPNTSGNFKNQNETYLFLNPKAGVQYQINKNSLLYFTYGRASREPVRDDFINSSSSSLPKPEYLDNFESGYKNNINKLFYTLTAYYMKYKNQLALTGKINDVGSYTRINIDKSYRFGFEIETQIEFNKMIEWKFNMSLSENKIKTFNEYVDDWTNGGQVKNKYENTNLVLSPNCIIGSNFILKTQKNLKIIFNTKFVSRQYLDNTQTKSRSIEPYMVDDIILQYEFKLSKVKNINIGLMINNIENKSYIANGYTYSGIINNNRKDFSFVYPQSGTNVLSRIVFLF